MSSAASWPSAAVNWLDERGKGAWIALMVLGFIFFWPVGLAILGYMIWSNRMFAGKKSKFVGKCSGFGFKSSGNVAFDNYKAQTIRRLEEEQDAFNEFVKRLRESKDKTQFDQFMEERKRNAASSQPPTE